MNEHTLFTVRETFYYSDGSNEINELGEFDDYREASHTHDLRQRELNAYSVTYAYLSDDMWCDIPDSTSQKVFLALMPEYFHKYQECESYTIRIIDVHAND